MKKVVLALAVVFSVALVSCSSKENKAEDSVVADTTVATEQVATDSNCCNDSAACCNDSAACCDSTKTAE